jgi:GH35 family endo-1,4-beta-xylanase
MKLIFCSFLLIACISIGHAYTFTSSEGAKFDGELLEVRGENVRVKRALDNREFTWFKSKFSLEDQQYFEAWAETNRNMPEGRRLQAILADKYPQGSLHIGGTTGWNKREQGTGYIIDREFSYVTPENDFKQATAHPEPGVWNWKPGDKWIEHCAEINQVVRLHGPISPQCSEWAKEDHRTAEELEQNLIEYMTAQCQRYDAYEHVKWMEVVNETVTTRGEWFGPEPGTDKWENPWTIIGYDLSHPLEPPLYIKMAFEIATQHAPNTKLIINQYGGMEDTMWLKVKNVVIYLREKGLRVDGIGWQAHVNTGFEKEPLNMERLHELIDWAHNNELSFNITEMNAWLKGDHKDYEAQAKTFAAILEALLEHRFNGEISWNVWNITDGLAWVKNRHKEGTLFDANGEAKPAYYAVQEVLENPPPPRAPLNRTLDF